MASDMDDPVTDDEKIRIASEFILHSPPGEMQEVFNDVRCLVKDDLILKQGASNAFRQYDKDQLTPVQIDGSNFLSLICEYNDLGDGRFWDPRSQQSFKYDHLKKEAMDFKTVESPADHSTESWRRALEETLTQYTQDHYPHGVSCVFSSKQDSKTTLTAVIEDHEYQAKNFWNGKWRSIWSFTFTDVKMIEVVGTMKVQVHFYEDGNIQCYTSKIVNDRIPLSVEQETASAIIELIDEAETEYGIAIAENFACMSETTFKALRRLLPVTRTKIDWGKILTIKKLGSELKNH